MIARVAQEVRAAHLVSLRRVQKECEDQVVQVAAFGMSPGNNLDCMEVWAGLANNCHPGTAVEQREAE
jgi:hypothetical protein